MKKNEKEISQADRPMSFPPIDLPTEESLSQIRTLASLVIAHVEARKKAGPLSFALQTGFTAEQAAKVSEMLASSQMGLRGVVPEMSWKGQKPGREDSPLDLVRWKNPVVIEKKPKGKEMGKVKGKRKQDKEVEKEPEIGMESVQEIELDLEPGKTQELEQEDGEPGKEGELGKKRDKDKEKTDTLALSVLDLNLTPKQIKKKYILGVTKLDDRAGSNGSHLMSQDVAKSILRVINPKANSHLVEFFPGPALVTREFLKKRGRHAYCIEEDSRYSAVAKELDFAVGKRANYVFGHVRGIGDYGNFDEVLGQHFDQLPIHPWNEVHPTVQAFCTCPPVYTETIISRFIRLMAEKYLIYGAGRIRLHIIVPKATYEKMVAEPGDHAYCKTTVLVKIFTDLEFQMSIDPSSIYPSKSLEYSLVTLTPKAVPLIGSNFEMECLEFILRQALLQRRTPLKEIVTTLGPNGHELLAQSGLNPDLIPCEMPPEDFGRLARAFELWEHRMIIDDTELISNLLSEQ